MTGQNLPEPRPRNPDGQISNHSISGPTATPTNTTEEPASGTLRAAPHRPPPKEFPMRVIHHLAMATILASTALSSGCVVVSSNGSGWSGWNGQSEHETRKLSVEHVAGKPLTVKGINGGIKVRIGGTTTVEISADVRAKTADRLALVKVHAVRSSDGTLSIEAEFPSEHKSGDAVAFEVTIPDVLGVTIDTSNGAIDIAGLKGLATLESSNAKIVVEHHDGPVNASTSNGSIELSQITGAIAAETSNAKVKISEAQGKVNADSSNGSISVSLTRDNPGPVKLDTSNASITLDVGSGFKGTLVADTSNGSVTAKISGTAKVTNSKNPLKVDFGPGEKSVLDTSNGSITVSAEN